MPLRHPAAPYVAPFLLFILCLAALPRLALPPRVELPVWLLSGFSAVWFFSRGVLDFRPRFPLSSFLFGIGVFVLWIAPDALAPEWRGHWLFSNPFLGRPESSLSASALADPLALALRTARAVLLVSRYETGWAVRAGHRNRQEGARILERDDRRLVVRARFEPPADLPYRRIVVEDEAGRRAWTNAI